MRSVRLVARFVVGLVASLTIVLALLYGALRNGYIERQLERIISALAQKEGVFFVRVEGVTGALPESVHARKVEVGDAYGVWLTVENAEATWHPFDLFHTFDVVKWRIHVDDVHAQRVVWTRLPRDGPDEIDTPLRWDRFVRIIVGHILVDDFELTGSILGGAKANLRAEGGGVLGEWEHGKIKLDIAHVDGTAGKATIDLETHGSPLELSGTIRAEEGPGGALAALARLKNAGAVTLSAEASGPMRDWRASANVTASNIGVLSAATNLSYTARGPFVVDGTFDPVPAQRRKYLVGDGAPMTFHAKGAWAPDVELRIDEARMSADGRNLFADGRLDLATREFRVAGKLAHEREGENVRLTILDLAAARLDGSGVLGDGGKLAATLDIDRASQADVTSERVHVTFRASDPAGDGAAAYELAADAGDLRLGDRVLPLFGAHAKMEAAGPIDIDRGTMSTEHLVLDGESISIEGPLAIRDDWGGMIASLRADASTLESLGDVFRRSVAGSATAQVDLEIRSEWDDRRVNVVASSSGVAIGESGWNALLGGATSLRFNVRHVADGPAHGELELAAAGISATARGDIAPDGTLAGETSVRMDNLARLSNPARAEIAGRVDATATARGTRKHFDVDATLRGSHVSYEGIHFDALAADIRAKDLPETWSANVRSRGHYGQLEAALDADVSMPSSDRLVVRGGRLSGPKTTASADLDVDLARGVADGTVVASSADLSLWRPMIGTAIGGALDVDARLSSARSASGAATQLVTGTAKIRNGSIVVDATELFVDVLEAKASGVEIGPAPRGAADVRVTRARYGTRTLVEGTLAATGNGSVWNVESTADVRNGEAIRFSAAAEVGVTRGGGPRNAYAAQWTANGTVVRADATVDSEKLRLEAPAPFRVSAAAWTIGPTAFAIGDGGHVRGRIASDAGGVQVEADTAKLPLSLVSVFVPELDLEGAVDGTVRLSGKTFATSNGDITLHGERVASTGLEAEGVEPVDLDANLRLGGGRIAGSAHVAGLAETRLELKLDAPLVSTSSAAPVVVDLVWKGSVAEIAALLPIGEDIVNGRVDADLRLSGSVAAPRVTGRAVLDGGVWENANSGLVLRDIHAEIEGAGTSLQLRALNATDGASGKVSAVGGVRFEGFPAFDATANIEAKDALLTRLDLLTTKADATIVAKASRGSGADRSISGSVTGKVEIVDARVEIPQRFVADVPELDVVEADTTADLALHSLPLPQQTSLALDIAVTGDNRIFVTGRGLESEWSSDVHVRGTTVDPRADGNITSVRGQLSLLGKRFDVTSATLHFDGERGNVPWLSMIARAEANEITAIAEVSGPATRPTIELRSEPSLPRDEVLSRLLFGQSAATLTPLQSVALARSVAELTGSPLAGGGGFLTNIGRSLGFDRLGIESAAGTGDAALTASRYITDRVYLRVQQGMTPEASKLSLEWKIWKHITIESDVSQDAQGEVGATWRWDY